MVFCERSRPLYWLVMSGVIGMGSVEFAWSEDVEVKSVRWRSSYADAAAEAAAQEKPLLVEFSAPWCGACRQMEKLTFNNSRLIEYVDATYVPLKLDADQHADLLAGFRVESLPTTLVVSPELKIVKRFSGFQSATTLLPELEKIIQQEFAGREVIQPVSASSPANTSPFAFEGFCLVSILDSQKLRRGNGEFTATYKDQTVCFCSDAHRKTFLANPTRYWPVANGKCLVTESENQQQTVGDPRLGVTWRGRLWLFTDRASQKRFIQSPRKYISSGM